MARRGRKTNWDKKIAELIAGLRRALVAREQDRIEQTVAAQMSALVGGLQGPDSGSETGNAVAAPAAPAAEPAGRGNRKRRSEASRKAQSLKMKAYWAAKRAGKAKSSSPKKGKAGKSAKAKAESAEADATT